MLPAKIIELAHKLLDDANDRLTERLCICCLAYAGEEVELTSTNCDKSSYNEVNRELRVTFHTGETYSYAGVPLDVAMQFYAAASHGRELNDSIKPYYKATHVKKEQANV